MPGPLPARIPHPDEHVRGCSQHSINSLRIFSLTPSSLFGNGAAPLRTEEYTQQCLFRAEEMCTLQSPNQLRNMLMAAGWPQAPGS